MLKINIDFDFEKECITDVDSYFNVEKEKDWFNREDVKKIILGIDKTIAVKDEYMESPIFGAIPPDRLSSGCKAVILMLMCDDINVYATRCGNNCVPYILEVAKTKDVEITLHHCMEFPEDGWEALVVDTGVIVRSQEEFEDEYDKVYDSVKVI